MAKAKKTRKELLKEPDEFITITGKLIKWTVKYQNQLTYALIALIIIALGISAYRFFSARAEAQAAQLLHQAVAKYEQLQADKTPVEVHLAISGDFRAIIDNYGNKKNGKMARLRFADICYEAGEFKQAITLYRKALSQFELFPLLRNQILSNLAMAHVTLGEDQDAIDYFEQIVTGTTAFNKDTALFHLGSLYARAGQNDKSKAAYDRLLSEFEGSTYRDLVPKQTNG